MPSVSKKQHNLMALVANDPKAAKRLGIPQSVGRDFMKADKGRKFNSGGLNMPGYKMGRMAPMPRDEREMPMRRRGGAPMIMRKGGKAESREMVKKEVAFMKKKGAPKSMIRHEEEEMRGGKVKKMNVGGPSRGRGAEPGPGSMAFLGKGPGPQDYYRFGPFRIPKGYSDQKQRHEAVYKGIPYDPRVNWMPRPPSREQAIKNFPNPKYDPAYDPKLAAQAEAFKKSQPKGKKPKETGFYDSFAGDMPSNEPGINMPEDQGEIKNRKGGKIHSRMKAHKAPKEHRYAGGGMTYSSGGSVFRKAADGIASKGKTKGKMVKMAYGGKC